MLPRRLIPRFATLLTLAAIVNIALAWTFAAFSSARPRPATWAFNFRGVNWTIIATSGPGLQLWQSDAYRGDGPNIATESLRDRDLFGQIASRTNDLRVHPATAACAWSDFAFGWPMPAMRYSREEPAALLILAPSTNAPPPGALPLKTYGALVLPRAIVLPCLPLWSGFLQNTVFYAFLLALGHTGIRRLTRGLRADAGRCPACAYDRTYLPLESPCPECGHAAP